MVGRISGVALALGVGGAVAIGLAAQASAAPTEPSTPSVRAAGADTARSATGRATRPTAHRRAALSAVAAAPASAVPKPSAAASRPVLAVPVPAPGTAPAPVAQATPADIFSSLATRIAGIFGWDPRGRQITIYKGTHFAIPNSFGLFIRQAAGTGTFTADTVYDLGDADQFDWNKFTGIAFTPLEPDRDAAMVGWRYNLTSQEFEIAPFYNVNKARILPDERTEVISVPAGETFQFLVDYTGITLTYGDTTVYKPYPAGLTPNVWTAARVSGWFGGNEVAPRTVSYYLKLI